MNFTNSGFYVSIVLKESQGGINYAVKDKRTK